jgi:hypothetical protein
MWSRQCAVISVLVTYQPVIVRVNSHAGVCLEVQVAFRYVSFRLLNCLSDLIPF